ncbi:MULTISPECIES: hypothetical protein [unclassified Arthrobacter]|uniref:hypothetical protein n=1 Tax=unclassified Arthrobacter TaxID=235627 RepID=UPI001491DF9A|nr:MULTISPECIES: hypothetical protein [unclassified Arthrobacter]MBE0008249.1 hypothetical protein [Arthrobacter sp. AET 35A]NOJ61988.1 hypothetical protein [Arthrobacter sp. 147(2020)]
MALLIIVGSTIALFAYIGRMSMPAAERLPVRSWGIRRLATNVWRGLAVCSMHTPVDRALEDIDRWQRAAGRN